MTTNHPLVPGDRVRHYGQQYTRKGTASIIEVLPGALGTYEYRVRLDDEHRGLLRGSVGPEITQWNSESIVFVEHAEHCSDIDAIKLAYSLLNEIKDDTLREVVRDPRNDLWNITKRIEEGRLKQVGASDG